jgi:hypothetical protein
VDGPVLITGVLDYARVFGGLMTRGRPCPVAHAAQLFFANGGTRLYVQRVFTPTEVGVGGGPEGDFAAADLTAGGQVVARWSARWPGTAGSRIRIVTTPGPAADQTVDVEVHLDGRVDRHVGLSVVATEERFVGTVLGAVDPTDEHGLVRFEVADPSPDPDTLITALLSAGATGIQLGGGSDGGEPTPTSLATGLEALGKVDEIALVALPDAGAMELDASGAAATALVAHCEEHPYRLGFVDPPSGLDVGGVLAFRARFDSSRAALYHPWLLVDDPSTAPGGPPSPLPVPPSGAVAGICARVDRARGVHVAPADERVLGIVGLAADVSTADQERLNPAGVNAIRTFPGRGTLVWGARTMSSDPEWKYVSIRRLFAFLEHSIDQGTQWAVFEPNGEPLWAAVRRAVEDFLLLQWQAGMLIGQKPEDSFFVRCDRSTMTQNDLDNGRLVVLIGVSAVRPAEFVVLRIGQWTADARS